MHSKTFFAYNIVGGTLWTAVFTYAGFYIGKELQDLGVNIEIIADPVLPLNSCKIETDSCVIDTGLDTRLTTLVNSIRLLAGGGKKKDD